MVISINKKPLWYTVSMVLCLVLIALVTTGCEDTKTLPKLHTVNFMGEEVSVESQSIEHGMRATKPENPERENYGFGGWFTDNRTFANEWNFKTDIVTRDTTLYAKWEENLKNYPVEIPFTEYSLVGCQWQWVNIGVDKIIVIYSNHELENYIQCDGDYSEFDFTKYTLLLARGTGTSGIATIKIQLQQISSNEYSLSVDIARNATTVPQGWFVSIEVPKLHQNDVVTLNINDHP